MNKFNDIKKFRKDNHLTQKELADKCGVTLRTVQNWEGGKTVPDSIVKLLQKINGEGEMLRPTQNAIGDNNTQVAGNSNTVNSPSTLDNAIAEISEQRKLVAKSQGQIDRLLAIIERMQAI